MKIKDLYENEIKEDDLLNYISSDYSEAYQRALDGYYIYKGMSGFGSETEMLKLSPIKNRRSANTLNYYTLWINNNEQWSAFPKRAVICTNSRHIAGAYGDIYIIFPKNGSDIAMCPRKDIWLSFHKEILPTDVNWVTRNILIAAKISETEPNSYKEMIEYFKKFDSLSKEERKHIIEEVRINDSEFKDILIEEGLNKLYNYYYSPKDFGIQPISSFNELNYREIWFDNDFIALKESFAEPFLSKQRRKYK